MIRALGISGSLQARSSNHALLQTAAALAPTIGATVELCDALRRLPWFNPDLEQTAALPEVTAWRTALANCDAVVIACPEYGHSLPGALKNGIDWVIGSGELNGKVVAITAAVPHPERGRLGLQALRTTLKAIDAVIVGGEPITKGARWNEQIESLLRSLVAAVAERSAT